MEGERMIECGIIRWWSCRLVIKLQKNSQKRSPKKVVLGSPGRGVLRFWVGGIQESRSFLGQKRAKNQKMARLRG